MIPFEWDEPRSLKKAVALLDPEDSSVRPIAGGTALMLMMKTGVFSPTRLVSLAKIEPKYSQVRRRRARRFARARSTMSAACA